MGNNLANHIYALNKKLSFNYNIHDKFEAGIILSGDEVKSVRFRNCNIDDAFIIISKQIPIIENFHIAKYKFSANREEYTPTQSRILLLKHREINKINGTLVKNGFTIVPTKIYNSKNNFIKIEIAIVSGKKTYDKRQDIKNREWQRDKHRILKEKNHN